VQAPPPIVSIPAAYGDALAEYRAIREGCAIDRVQPRAIRLADDLVTASAGLYVRPAQGAATCLAAVILRPDGNVVGAATVVTTPGRAVLLDVSNRLAADALPQTVPPEDEVARIRLRGPATGAVLEAAGLPAAGPPGTAIRGLPGDDDAVLCRTGADRVALYCPVGAARGHWQALLGAGAVPVGSVALETARIEDAEPCLERDFRNPLPASAAGFRDFAPYPAAEVAFVAIEHEGMAPLPGAALAVDGTHVGEVRVAASSIRLGGRPVALAVLMVAHAGAGNEVDVGRSTTWSRGIVTAAVRLPADAAAPNY
jgi:glycine cleavage system aminomethyltransferase T